MLGSVCCDCSFFSIFSVWSPSCPSYLLQPSHDSVCLIISTFILLPSPSWTRLLFVKASRIVSCLNYFVFWIMLLRFLTWFCLSNWTCLLAVIYCTNLYVNIWSSRIVHYLFHISLESWLTWSFTICLSTMMVFTAVKKFILMVLTCPFWLCVSYATIYD